MSHIMKIIYLFSNIVIFDFWTDLESEGHLSEFETMHQRVIYLNLTPCIRGS